MIFSGEDFMFNPWPTWGEAAEAADAHGFIMALPQGPGFGGFFGRWRPLMPRVVFFVEKMRILSLKIFLSKGTWGFSTAKDGDVIWSSRISFGWNISRKNGRKTRQNSRKNTQNSMIFHLPTGAVIWGIHWGIHEDYYFIILGIIWES